MLNRLMITRNECARSVEEHCGRETSLSGYFISFDVYPCREVDLVENSSQSCLFREDIIKHAGRTQRAEEIPVSSSRTRIDSQLPSLTPALLCTPASHSTRGHCTSAYDVNTALYYKTHHAGWALISCFQRPHAIWPRN